MRKMTEENLRHAFRGEAIAHMRYLIFADKADEEGRPNIARLFRAIAYAEQIHARNHFQALGEISTTVDHLKSAIESEEYEIEEMYPAFDTVAKLQGEIESVQSIHFAIEAEKPHSILFNDAMRVLKRDEFSDIGENHISICSNCGYTIKGLAESVCIICGNATENFKQF